MSHIFEILCSWSKNVYLCYWNDFEIMCSCVSYMCAILLQSHAEAYGHGRCCTLEGNLGAVGDPNFLPGGRHP